MACGTKNAKEQLQEVEEVRRTRIVTEVVKPFICDVHDGPHEGTAFGRGRYGDWLSAS